MQRAKDLIWEERGTATLIFGLVLFILIGGMALALDTARIYGAEARLSFGAERAAEAAARNLHFMSEEDLEALATALFNGTYRNMNPLSFAGESPAAASLTISPDMETGRVTVTASATVPTTLMRTFNFFDDITISTSVSVRQSMPDMELVLTLEATEALATDGRLADIRTASLGFLDSLKSEARVGTGLKFAALPYGDSLVNVAPHKNWVTPGIWPVSIPPVVPGIAAWSGPLEDQRWCVDIRSGAAGSDDTPPSGAPFPLVLTLSTVPDAVSGLPVFSVTTTADCRPEPVQPLTTDPAAIETEIAGLTGVGTASAGRAMLWTERLLSPRWQGVWNADSTIPAAYDDAGIRKSVVLIAASDNAGGSAEDNLFSATCARLKSNGVNLYTIDYLASAATADRIKACASSAGQYFHAATAAELQEALYSIAKTLTRVRFAG